MAYRDIYHSLKVSQLVDPATVTSDTNSSELDLKGYDSAMLVFNVGESGDSLSGSIKIELEVEESDDNSTWTDVADADLTNVVSGTNDGTVAVIDAAAEDDSVHIVGYKGTKRYVRGVINLTGTHSNGTPMSVSGVRAHAHQKPTN